MTEAELLEVIAKAAKDRVTSLDLSRKNIETIPPEIAQLTNLQELNLRFNKISVIPEAIAQLINLQRLNLEWNQISVIPEAIAQLINLQRLNLDKNQISIIPNAITQLTNLQELSLYGNQISVIPNAIAQLTNLQKLYLGGNQISVIPEAIAQLTNLHVLYLSSNQISVIPEVITQLTNLHVLNLSSNQISVIPEAITQLTNLQKLGLGGNQISVIPEAITQLTNLQELSLNSSQTSVIPEAITQLTNLQKLYLGDNQISIIPDAIAQLTNLQELGLGGNQISVIPEAIAQLTNLHVIILNSNQISVIPEAIAQLTNLHVLILNSNQISVIPEAIAQLTNLQWLNLSDNQISVIPEAIAQLTKLQRLFLSSNKISIIPEAITQLANLQELSLSSNKISIISEAITQLSNLEKLNLSINQITEIPDSLSNLTSLKELHLHENPLPIPVEILEDYKNPAAIISYWQKLKQGERKPLNEAKVILVGRGDVGKTSLVKRLIDDEFNENEPKTEGINISEWQVSAREENVRLRVWDFGGQEIMHATHQFFLTERSLYVLVLNTRKDERISDVEYWLKLIQTFGKNAPILIVGNKCDETGFDLDEKGLRDKYGENIKQFIPTSCKTGVGIAALRQEIIQQIAQMDHVFDLLPQQWFAVKTKLEQSQADYIPYHEYQQLCQQEKITDSPEQSTLIKLLHDLGIILNFRDDPRLKDTNVLKPDWVTGGVYKILNNNELMTEHKGRLEWKTCQSILAADCYREDQEKLFILDMMKKFKLSFPLDTTPDIPTYLIPDLLPKSEPYTGEWQDTLNFEYHYPILPNSIISRFTVEMYQLIFMQTFWRTGVILKFEDNKAYIKADLEDAKIFIRISGNPTTRRSFLSAIRTTFEKVHGTISGLKARQYIPLPSDDPNQFVEYDDLIKLEARGKQEFSTGKRDYIIRELIDGIEERRSRNKPDDFRDDHYLQPQVNVTINNQLNQNAMTPPEKPQADDTPKSPEIKLPSLTAASITFAFLFTTTAFLILVFAGVLNIFSFITAMFSIVLLLIIAVIFVLKATGQMEGQSFEKVILAVLKQLTLYDALLSKLGDIFGKSKN